jgi:hypothetical protein
MFMKMRSAALAAALLLAGTVNAAATPVWYTDFASWSGAVSGSNTLVIPEPVPNVIDTSNPPNLLPGFQYFGSGSASFGFGGVVFGTKASLSDGDFFNVGPTFPGSNGPLPVLSSQGQTTGVANILITLANPVNAFSLNFDTFFGSDVTFTLSNGETLTLGSGANAYDLKGFFGVVDNNPFKTILLTSQDLALNINGLNFGAAVAPIPEPATWVMLLLGFVGIGLYGARLPARRASAAADRAQS